MANQDVFEVKVFRVSLFVFFIVGLAFLIVGLDAIVFKRLFTYTTPPGKEVLYFFFKLFFVVVGGLIVWKEGTYLCEAPRDDARLGRGDFVRDGDELRAATF